jgi:hypothetical protein
MAGSFGFESGEHYDVSIGAGERVILPKVRGASRDTIVVADGFSCREQIEQGTGRRALHLAQVLRMALREGIEGPRSGLPERTVGHGAPEEDGHRRRGVLVGAGVTLAAASTAGVVRRAITTRSKT